VKLRYVIPAAMAILALSVYEPNETYAHGPARGSGRSAGRSVSAVTRAAVAAQIAAQNPQLTAQQIMAANTARATLAAQIAAQNPQIGSQQANQLAGQEISTLVTQRAAQIAAQYPQLTAQQATLLATREIPTLAAQIKGSNSALAALAAQIAAENPQLSAQQASALAGQEVSAIATQTSSAAQAALAAQIAAQNPRLSVQQAYALAALEMSPFGTQTSNAARAALAAQIAAQNPQLSAQQAYALATQEIAAANAQNSAQPPLFPPGAAIVPGLTPGFSPSFGTGTFPPAAPMDTGAGGETDAASSSTADGAALQGTAQVIRAAGQYDLATAKGAINMTQAESNEMRNQVQGVQTFYEMRAAGRAGREMERGPTPASEEFTRRAHAAAPRGLDVSQLDPATGDLHWPGPLQHAEYDSQRSAVDEYTLKWVRYGALDLADQRRVRENITAMFEVLKSQITEIPPQDYLACRSFLQSLLYTTTRSII